MKRLKGPEIKLPKLKGSENLKAPRVLVDLYHDLDERHLLPVVAILIVGIIAIPLLLNGSSESDNETAAVDAGASASVAPSADQSSLVVAKSTPRLRKYQRRLGHLQAKDPFRPHYAGSSDETTASDSSGATASAETTTESTATTAESGETGTAGESAPVPTTVPDSSDPNVTFFSYAIDVRVVPVSSGEGKPSEAEPTVRHKLPPLVMLPSRDTPALTYIGPSRDGKKAIMMVSEDVVSLFGDSPCILGSQNCQLLALEPDSPETVIFGPKGRTYRIELLKIDLEFSDHLNESALGKPKHPSQGKSPGKSGN
jgi:hypothetical protein